MDSWGERSPVLSLDTLDTFCGAECDSYRQRLTENTDNLQDPAATVRGISMTDCHLLTEYWENRYRPLSPSQPGRWERYLQILESSSWQFSDIYCHITFSHTITIWDEVGATSKLSMSIVSFMLSDTIYHRRSWPPFVWGARIYWTYSDFLNSFPTT